jgi:hypothetical protein
MASRATDVDMDSKAFARAEFTVITPAAVQRYRAAIDRVGRLSDSIIGVGPIGIGLDGILAWVPGLGEIYSVAAGGFLLFAGYRAKVPPSVLVQAAAIVAVRTAIDTGNFIPVVGVASSLIVDLFRGHKWAASLLTRAIDETLYLEGPWNPTSPAYLDALARIRRGGDKRRVVFLG